MKKKRPFSVVYAPTEPADPFGDMGGPFPAPPDEAVSARLDGRPEGPFGFYEGRGANETEAKMKLLEQMQDDPIGRLYVDMVDWDLFSDSQAEADAGPVVKGAGS